MKTAIKLSLLYLGIQILASVIVVVPLSLYKLVRYGSTEGAANMAIVPAMLLAFVLMGLYLWKAGYISTDRQTWSPVSFGYLVLTTLLTLSFILLNDFVLYILPPIPDLTTNTFDLLQASWVGIACVAVLGPITEELIFRGGATRALLKTYSPVRAIIISGLIFGLIHLNPPQVIGASFSGFVMAWLYYKTGSLIPAIWMHIINNTLAVVLSLRYPDIDYLAEVIGVPLYYQLVTGAAILFALMIVIMNRRETACNWKEITYESN